jgi:hypothetical protein
MAYSAADGRRQILDAFAEAIDLIGFALACLGEAYEQLDETTGDRLEEQLFRPVQTAYGRGKRTHADFAARHGLESRAFEPQLPGVASQGVKLFIERAGEAARQAGHDIGVLQDSMLPVEVGDPELRAGLAEVRVLLDDLTSRSREFVRTLGR